MVTRPEFTHLIALVLVPGQGRPGFQEAPHGPGGREEKGRGGEEAQAAGQEGRLTICGFY